MDISEDCIECIESKYNSLHGLSILKIPAKVVNYPNWGDVRGLHTRCELYPRNKATKATCYTPPSIAGGPSPDTNWLKTDDAYFIRAQDQTGGELKKLVLEKCIEGPRHWVGLLKLDQQPYYYREPRVGSKAFKLPRIRECILDTSFAP